ncbi:MAG: DHH family phosphoesterase [Candidatus Hermodarchaeota archaeon]
MSNVSSGSSVHFELIEGILAQIPGTKLHDGRVITKIEEIRSMKSRVKSRGTMYAVARLDVDSTDKISSSLGEVAEVGITWFDSAYRMNQTTSAALRFGFLSPQILYSGAISTSPELWCSIKEWQEGNSISDLLPTTEVDIIINVIDEMLNLLKSQIYKLKYGELSLEDDVIIFRDEYLTLFRAEGLLSDDESDKMRNFAEKYAGNRDWGVEGKVIHGDLNAGNIIVQGDLENDEIRTYRFIDMKKEDSNDYLKDLSKLLVTLFTDLLWDPSMNYRKEIMEDLIIPIGEWLKKYSEQIGDQFYEERLHFWIVRQLLCSARWQVINKTRTFDLEKQTKSTQIAQEILSSALRLLDCESKLDTLVQTMMFWRADFRKKIQQTAKNFVESVHKRDKTILLVGHNDADGISSLIFLKAIADHLHLTYDVLAFDRAKMTFSDLFRRVESKNYDVIVLIDIGSPALDLIVENLSAREVFILDHHHYDSKSKMVMEIIDQYDSKELITTAKDLETIEDALGTDLTNKIGSFLNTSRMTAEEFLQFANRFRNFRIVNPFFFNIDESREINAGSITHLFAKEILPEDILKELSWVGVIGIIGDRMDQPQKFAGFNRIVLKEAMEAGKITRTEETLPFDELKEIADEYIQNLILPDKKGRFSSVPLFAFLIDMLGSIDPDLAMQCYEEVPLVAENRYISLVNDLMRILQSIDDFCLVELETRPIIAFDFIETPTLNSSLASLLVNQLQEKVIVAMTVEPTGLRVSLRVPERLVNIGYTNSRTLAKKVAARLGAHGAGHKTASAIRMPKTDVSIRAQMIHVISILQDSMKEFIG